MVESPGGGEGGGVVEEGVRATKGPRRRRRERRKRGDDESGSGVSDKEGTTNHSLASIGEMEDNAAGDQPSSEPRTGEPQDWTSTVSLDGLKLDSNLPPIPSPSLDDGSANHPLLGSKFKFGEQIFPSVVTVPSTNLCGPSSSSMSDNNSLGPIIGDNYVDDMLASTFGLSFLGLSPEQQPKSRP